MSADHTNWSGPVTSKTSGQDGKGRIKRKAWDDIGTFVLHHDPEYNTEAKMDRQTFMGALYKKVQEFEAYWNKMQRENPADWPNEFDEAEWWEQFMVWLQTETE